MFKRLEASTKFARTFVKYTMKVRATIVSLLLLIVLGGCAIARVEGIKLGNAIYFAFITGLSIGYGDIHPETSLGKIVSVAIGLIGILFVGLTVAIATRALRDTIEHSKKTN
jgi:voltage-gated potassium channel